MNGIRLLYGAATRASNPTRRVVIRKTRGSALSDVCKGLYDAGWDPLPVSCATIQGAATRRGKDNQHQDEQQSHTKAELPPSRVAIARDGRFASASPCREVTTRLAAEEAGSN